MLQRIFHLCLTLTLACCLLAPGAEAKEKPEAVRKAAEAGDPVAQTRLGLAYSSGEWNLEKNEQEALSWFNKAAESGYAPGQAGLCFAYIEGGQGVEKDETRAKEWCDKAAKALPALTGQGDVLAQFSLGVMYFRGLGVPENIGEAERLMRLVAEQGFALGQFVLAGIYVEKDEQEAVNWLRKAAEQGLADAKEALDEMHKNARGLPQDDKEAQMHENGQGLPQDDKEALMLGMAYRYGGQGRPLNDVAAAELFRKAAEKGNDIARCELGAMHWNGNGMRKDEREAEKWCGPAAEALQKAAERGDALARRNVGRMRQLGLALPKDVKQAADWYRKAADQGDAAAQYTLGRMYEKGEDLPRDDAQAAALYMKAAEQGHAEAQYALGWMYRNGRGVTEDNEQAVQWFLKAAVQGFPRAQMFLGWLNDSPLGWLFGSSAEEWYKKGLSGLMKAAKRGDPKAMFDLYLAYSGDMLDDAAEAAYWRLKAEEQVGADTVQKWIDESKQVVKWGFLF